MLIWLALGVPAVPAAAGGIVAVCDEAHLLEALTGGGTVTFGCSGTIFLTNEIAISSDTAIDGSGHAVTLSGDNAVRVFAVPQGVTLSLSGLTIANGNRPDDAGGAIYNSGRLIIAHSSLIGNAAGSGGAITNQGSGATLDVSNSTFSDNSATDFQGAGGAIFNDYGTATVSHSTFSGNSADEQGLGGAVYNRGTLTVSNSTFFANTANPGGGGAIFTGGYGGYGALIAINCTFSGNSAYAAGGIFGYAGTTVLENSIVANNRPGGNCSGTIFDGGGNLSYPGSSCPGTNGDPLLGPLQDNGGPTQTMALGPGSAALEAGIDAICAAHPVDYLDQRGVTRPQGSRCDSGAVEQQPYRRTWLPNVRSQ